MRNLKEFPITLDEKVEALQRAIEMREADPEIGQFGDIGSVALRAVINDLEWLSYLRAGQADVRGMTMSPPSAPPQVRDEPLTQLDIIDRLMSKVEIESAYSLTQLVLDITSLTPQSLNVWVSKTLQPDDLISKMTVMLHASRDKFIEAAALFQRLRKK